MQNHDFIVFRLSSDGSIEWNKTYGGIKDDYVYSIQQTSDGGYIVAGETSSFGAGQEDIWVLKLALDGTVEWQKTYGGGSSDRAYSIQQTIDGGYIVAGSTTSFGAGLTDFIVLKLFSDGAVEWQKTYGGSKNESARSIQQTVDGGYIVAGETGSFGTGEEDIWVLKLFSDGSIEWQKTYGGRFSDRAYSIQQIIDGGYIVAGCTDSYGEGKQNSLVIKLSPDGDIDTTCEFAKESNAEVSDPGILPINTDISPGDIDITSLDTNITPKDSEAIVYSLCTGQHTLSLYAASGGTTDPQPGTHVYDHATRVIIKASPEDEYSFSEWSGDASGTDNPLSIVMDSDKSIIANFKASVVYEDVWETVKKTPCFIATAAYGSSSHPYVCILRDFRDKYLMPSRFGRNLVDIYYRYSPFLADLIKKHKVLKIAVRTHLFPLVVFSYSMVHFGLAITAVILVFVLVLPIFFISFSRRKIRQVKSKDSRVIKKVILPLLCFILLSLPASGQEEKKEALAIKTDKPIKIDGLLDEPAWENASDAGIFIQHQLDRRDAHKVKTSAKILWDDNFVYIGFLCYDEEPDKIVAQTIKMDGDLRDTDSVYILIDTFHDRSNFYYFSTNFLGAQSDGKISKDGQTADFEWDGAWEASSQKTDFGWSTEVAIGFSSIFDEPKRDKSFGLGLSRIVPRLDKIFRTGPLDPAFEVDQLGKLEVLDLVELEKGARITPYISAQSESGKTTEPAAGLDVRYTFSQQMFGRLTVNPDFATVEPDEEKVNLTPFELYLPEKRDLFLKGSEIYKQHLGLFYTKRIGDIYGGAKINGEYGNYEFSGMSAQTKKDNYPDEDSANFSVFRFKGKNIMNSLTIGFTAANKLIDKKNKGTAGVDADLYLSRSFKLSGQFAVSYGDYGKDNSAFFLGPSYDSKTFHIHLHYTQIGRYFGDNVNHVGFIPDDNRRELDSAINKAFLFRKGILEQIRYCSNYNIYWGMDGTLRSWQIDEGLFLDFKNKFTFSVHHTQEYKLNEYFLEPELIYVPGEIGQPDKWIRKYIKDFRNYQIRIQSEYYAEDWKSFRGSISYGRNFGSDFFMFRFSKKLKLVENLFSEYHLTLLNYAEPRFFSDTTINVLKVTYYATKKLFWEIFFQSNADIDKLNFHVVCLYTFKPPFSSIQLVYQKGTARFGEKGTQDHTLFLKLSYMF
jgi:uncharacterized delta-60 repeat protein